MAFFMATDKKKRNYYNINANGNNWHEQCIINFSTMFYNLRVLKCINSNIKGKLFAVNRI